MKTLFDNIRSLDITSSSEVLIPVPASYAESIVNIISSKNCKINLVVYGYRTSMNRIKLSFKDNPMVSVYTLQELLDGDLDNMTPDFVVGNPPFNTDTSVKDTQKTLYIPITVKCYELLNPGGIISFVTPQAILVESNGNKFYNTFMEGDLQTVNYAANDDFSIGQTVIAFTMQKKKNKNNLISIVNSDLTESSMSFPKICDKQYLLGYSIIWKMSMVFNPNLTKIKMVPVNDATEGYIGSKEIEEDGKFKVLTHYVEKPNKPRYVTTNKEQQIPERLIVPNNISLLNDNTQYAITNIQTTVGFNSSNINSKSREKLNKLEYEGMIAYFKSPLLKFFTIFYKDVYKPSGVNNAIFVLPQPKNLTNVLTNDELYKEFNITDEEKNYVEDWYSKWKK